MTKLSEFSEFVQSVTGKSYSPRELRKALKLATVVEKKQGPFKFSSTQLNLEGDTKERVLDIVDMINDKDLAADGKENEPHITVKYGLHTTHVEEVIKAVKDYLRGGRDNKIRVTLGKVDIFTNPDADLVYVEVWSEDLIDLNHYISQLSNSDKHPKYHPHLTLAYVKPGLGAKYKGWAQLEGEHIKFKQLQFSTPDGVKYDLPLDLKKIDLAAPKENLSQQQQGQSQQQLQQQEQQLSDNTDISGQESEAHQLVVAVDLDGTICEYDTWRGPEHFGQIRKGAREALQRLKDKGYFIVIWTTRGDVSRVHKYLSDEKVPFDSINYSPYQPKGSSCKVAARIYIDDRAINGAQEWPQIVKQIEDHQLSGESNRPQHLLKLPNIRQEDTYSCGAAVAMSVGRYFGVGPETLEEWKKALGTTEKTSTLPSSIVKYLESLGLRVDVFEHMEPDDLRKCWAENRPVITPIQEYGVPSKQASYEYGHYVAVIGADLGMIFVQDPSADNVLGRPGGTQGEADDPDSLQARGVSAIPEELFMRRWHDEDYLSKKYNSYGIAVGIKEINGPTNRDVVEKCKTGRNQGKPGPCPDESPSADTVSSPSKSPEAKSGWSRVKRVMSPEQSKTFNRWVKEGRDNDERTKEDLFLKELNKETGYDGKPQIVNSQEMDSLIKEGAEVLYRGVSSDKYVEQFKRGDFFAGRGIKGNGSYFAFKGKNGRGSKTDSEAYRVALTYASRNTAYGPPNLRGGEKRVIRAVLRPDAKICTKKEMSKLLARARSANSDVEEAIMWDKGALAALHGYDAVDGDFMIVLNRSALIVDDSPAPIPEGTTVDQLLRPKGPHGRSRLNRPKGPPGPLNRLRGARR